MRSLAVLLAASLLLTACSRPETVLIDPPAPPPGVRVLPDDAGHASFFLPVEVPLAEVRSRAEASVPRQIEEQRREEYSPLLDEESWRLLATRGGLDVGFSAERFVFRFPVVGRLTFAGRLRSVGVPVRESIDFSGTVTGWVKPALAADWQLRLDAHAQLDLSRAEVEIFRVVKIGLRGLLQDEIDPILEREFRRAAERAVADWKLREQAAEAWKALHFSQEVLNGEGLWLRFRPEEVRVAPLRAEGGRLRTGFAISGEVRLGFAAAAPPPPKPLPPLGIVAEPSGRLEIEVPVLASDADLSRLAAKRLQGARHKVGGYEMDISKASLRVLGDGMLVALDFEARGPLARGARGRLFLRGQPVFDRPAKVLRLAGLDYDLATRSRLLQAAGWLLRADLLASLERETRFDVAATLREADRQAQAAVESLRFPAGLQGEIRLESATVNELVVSDGYLYARCRITGRSTPLTWAAPSTATSPGGGAPGGREPRRRAANADLPRSPGVPGGAIPAPGAPPEDRPSAAPATAPAAGSKGGGPDRRRPRPGAPRSRRASSPPWRR